MEPDIKNYLFKLERFMVETELIKNHIRNKELVSDIKLKLLNLKSELIKVHQTEDVFNNARILKEVCHRAFQKNLRQINEIYNDIDIKQFDPLEVKAERVELITYDAWSKFSKLKDLILNLHAVLWKNSSWKRVRINDILEDDSIKKYYKKALLIVHPDKVPDDKKMLATQILHKLRDSYKDFEKH